VESVIKGLSGSWSGPVKMRMGWVNAISYEGIATVAGMKPPIET